MAMTPELQRLAHDQLGVVTRQQLLQDAVTEGEIRWQLGRFWRLLLPGVILLERGLPTPEQRQVGGLLYAGPTSWLAGPTALAHHRVQPPELTRRIHVLVPRSSTSRDVDWLSIRRTTLSNEPVVERGPFRYSCLPRAVVDTAAMCPSDAVARAVVVQAVQERLVRLDDVAHWVNARRRNDTVRLHLALAEAATGAWSVPEADLARLLATSRILPEAWPNPRLEDLDGNRLTTPDLWFDDVAMAVMVHSRTFHAGVLQWDETVEADGDLSASRVVVIGVTPTALARDPAAVLRRVEAAHDTARRSGVRAPVRATRSDLIASFAS